MRRPSRRLAATAVLVACVFGGVGMGGLFASTALADDGPGSPPPVSVTIPDLSQTATPTPTASASSAPTPPVVHRGGGGTVHVVAPPHQPGTEPIIPGHPATGTIKVTIAPSRVILSGDRMTVTATGFNPGEKVQLAVYFKHGKPIRIGNVAAGASGSFSHTFVVPSLDAGTDTVQLTGWDSSKVGIGTFLLGTNWVVARTDSERAIWLWIGGLAGLAALAALTWIGVASLRRAPAVEGGV